MSKENPKFQLNDAVKLAKAHFEEIFKEEGLTNLGLEEIDFDSSAKEWLITLGFSRPWNTPRNTFAAITGDAALKRAYRVVRLTEDGELVSIKRRPSLDE